MRIADFIEEFIVAEKWDNDVLIRNEEDNSSTLETSYGIKNQTFRLFIDSNEETELLFVYLFAPFSVVEGKSVDAALLFNYINVRFSYPGKLSLLDNGDIQYVQIIDLENVVAPVALIKNMIATAINCFSYNIEQIAAVALTRKTYEAIREEYEKKDAANKLLKKRRDAQDGNIATAEGEEKSTNITP